MAETFFIEETGNKGNAVPLHIGRKYPIGTKPIFSLKNKISYIRANLWLLWAFGDREMNKFRLCYMLTYHKLF